MKRVLFILTLLFVVSQIVEAQNPFVTHYTISNGLPSNDVYCSYQDRDGFMWFGTRGGVAQFDGNNFRYFSKEEGLNMGPVLRMKEDIEGRLWFLNYDGSLNFVFNNKIHNNKNTPFLKELKTNFYYTDFFQDKDSTLYFYNPSGEVFEVKNNELVDYNHYVFSRKRYFSTLLYLNKTVDDKFVLWSAAGIFKLKNLDDSLTQIKTELYPLKVFKKNKLESIVLDQHNFINIFKGTKLSKSRIQRLSSSLISSIAVDDQNYLWVASYNKGVYCYKNDSIVLHLPIKYTQNIVFDNENNIWIASNQEGVYKINRDILKYKFITNKQFEGRGITDLAASNQNGIWATNGEELFYILNQKRFPIKINIGGQILDNIYQLKNNSIILGGSGLNMSILKNVKVDEERKKIKFTSSEKFNFRVRSPVIDSSENFLYSAINDLFIKVNLNNLYDTHIFKISKGRINSVFFNRKNELIVNTNKFYLYKDSIYLGKDYQRFNGKLVSSHLVIDKNNELLNLQNDGIYLIRDSGSYNLLESYASSIDYQVKKMFYSDSTLFFSTMRTVYFISNIFNVVKGKPIHLSRLNIEFNDVNDIFCKDNMLYIASDDGLTFIPIDECVNASVKLPKPYLYKVALNDKVYDLSAGVVEFKTNKRLSIEFSSLNYSSIPSNYSYKLEGVDKDWINGNETKVVYLNLAPGEYVFKVKSRKNRQEFSNVVQLPIIVNPTLIQRPAAKLVLFLLIVFLVFIFVLGGYRRKMKKKETDYLLTTLENKALQSMMNPHFIFNALGSIQGYLLQNKSVEAGTYLSQFARLIRQNMNSLKSNSICVDDEIDRLRNYIELEKLRMNNKFEYQIEVDENLESYDIYIPSMIIQPFVENAIWHGISSMAKDGKLKIVFNYIEGESIEVLVEDNGIGLANEQKKEKRGNGLHMGVELTQKRLKLIGERQGVDAGISTKDLTRSVEFPGTQVRIIIPIVYSSI